MKSTQEILDLVGDIEDTITLCWSDSQSDDWADFSDSVSQLEDLFNQFEGIGEDEYPDQDLFLALETFYFNAHEALTRFKQRLEVNC